MVGKKEGSDWEGKRMAFRTQKGCFCGAVGDGGLPSPWTRVASLKRSWDALNSLRHTKQKQTHILNELLKRPAARAIQFLRAGPT